MVGRLYGAGFAASTAGLDLRQTKPYPRAMKSRSRGPSKLRAGIVLAVALLPLAVACGGDPPVVAPPKPAPTPTAAPLPTAEPTAAVEAPAPSAEADAGTAPKPKSGRPPILKSDPVEITDTFGSTPAAKLEIGDKEIALLRIPEQALDHATNVTFKLEPKGKSSGAPVGKIYRITMIVPPSGTPAKITTSGEPFELRLPAGNKKDANLAIGEIVTDDKGKEKIVWSVIAPTKIDDATSTAFFELTTLSDNYLHVTAKPVSGPPAEKKP